MKLDLSGKKALVAGGSRGIGLAIAEAFIKEEAQVTITARGTDGLDRARMRMEEHHGGRITAVTADMSDPSAAAGVLAEVGVLDIAVINFGATDTLPGFDTSGEEWERLIRANLTGPTHLARTLGVAMKAREEGVILFVGSIAGREAIGAPIAYGVGKCGLRAVMKTMARELSPEGVRVNLISPGNILFDGGRWADKRAADPQEIDRLINATVPMRRFGVPEEIAQVAVFICSPRASFMTGADIVVDGGQTVCF